MNRVNQLLGTKYPIIQGAMAQLATAQLAAAVSNAGGLGIIAAGGKTPDEVREQIHEARQLTDNNFGVNLMLMDPNSPKIAQVIVEEQVPIITTGAGTPKKLMPVMKANGIKVIPVIPNVELAVKMEQLGVDAVVAEGMEAGGHIGQLTSQVLWPQVSDAVSIPVIAAGGIADGRGIVDAFVDGAEGVQLGTLFSIAKESPVGPKWRQAIIEATDTSTIITGLSLGAPVRSLKNKMALKFSELERNAQNREELETIAVGGLKKAVFDDDVETGSLMAGQISGMIKEAKTCREIIEDLFNDANAVTNKVQSPLF
ncbi:enoyl-[acyl-carrier-protein] reductase FabK [Bombilactobacillus bombi]|uniref:Probable nitronate monooxygenase n=1 Tax=Bombilactobacillus bombi TaxID=1303590 RepID=A0A417ZHT0_9LACO|nr:nitronate monooxygenase [Bombilactobacillus bombi]RHW51256.1 enoyl-[acyl-carrier-protein] reductase FabK [Bombilactobacillus bombi]